jgi:hypothetical protein
MNIICKMDCKTVTMIEANNLISGHKSNLGEQINR